MASFFDQWTKYYDQLFFFINCSGFVEYNGFMPYLFTYRGGWRFGSGSKSSGLGVKKLLICFDCATLVSSPTISYNKKRKQPNLFNLNQKTESAKYTSPSQETMPLTRGVSFCLIKLSVALLRIFQISSAGHIAIGVRPIKVGRYARASPTPHHKWLEGRSTGFIAQPSWPTTKKKPSAFVRGLQFW